MSSNENNAIGNKTSKNRHTPSKKRRRRPNASDSDPDKQEQNSKPPASPQPKDDVSKHKPEEVEYSLESLAPSDKRKFITADNRRKEDFRNIMDTHSHLVQVRTEFQRVQSELEKAQKIYDETKLSGEDHFRQDADILLLDPSEWNRHYLQLKACFDREGNSYVRKNINQTDIGSMSEEEETEMRAMLQWISRQREMKRRGELEHSKELLLNCLQFDWDSETGHDPDEWLHNYHLLKEFKQKHGHVEVPAQYQHNGNKLGQWVKTQLSLYHNGNEGNLPVLSAERIYMIKNLALAWGEIPDSTPWEEQFQMLSDYKVSSHVAKRSFLVALYHSISNKTIFSLFIRFASVWFASNVRNLCKERFGHTDVPLEWEENAELAQWVNNQRNKFRDLKEGMEGSLNDEQIMMLNSIDFKWKVDEGHSPVDSQSNEQSINKAVTTRDESSAGPKTTPTPYLAVAVSNGASSTVIASPASANAANTTVSLEAQAAATVYNTQPISAQASQNYKGISSDVALDLNANANSYLYSSGIGTIYGQNLPGDASRQALISQALISQQLLYQQLVEQYQNNAAIAAHQASMQACQQLSHNPLLIQASTQYSTLQVPNNVLSNQVLQQLLAQQINVSSLSNTKSDSPPQDRKSG